ncbi:MAG: copper resistance CopC family protein, partial [Amnibacterium sp.]
ALAGALTVAAPAAAHDYLVSSSPAANSTVTKPIPSVTITFDAAVLSTDNGSTALSVLGPDGRHFETACPVVKNDDVSAAVRLGPAGIYRITWRIVSSDGHPVSDSVSFRYAPTSSSGAAAGAVHGPSCGNAAVGTDRASPAASSSSTGVLVLVAVVVGVLVVLVAAVVVVAVVLTRRRT